MTMTTPATMLRHTAITSIFCAVLLMCQLLAPANAKTASSATYSIVLESAPGKNLKWQARKSPLFKKYTLYAEQTTIKSSPWERLCLGFFDSRKQSITLLKKIQQIYPGAWIKKTTTKNINIIQKPDTTYQSKPTSINNTSTLTVKQLKSLMQRAKLDFKNKKYSSTIRYLNALISAGTHQYSREALELLGLARQRKKQTIHAVNIYEKYLVLYPDGDSSDRVRQRLAGLLTAASTPKDKIHITSARGRGEIITYGSLSQFYRTNRYTKNCPTVH